MRKPYTLLFDANPLVGKKTGIGYYTAGLITELAKHPDKVRLVGYYYDFLGRQHAPPELPGVSFRRIIWIPRQVVNALRRFGAPPPIEALTLIHADAILYSDFLGLPSLFKTPSSPIVYDLTYIDVPLYVSSKNARDLKNLMPKTLARAAFITTISAFSKQRIMRVYGVPSKDIIIAPVAPSTIKRPSPQETDVVLRHLKLSKGFILFMGTLEPRKNLLNLLKAYTLLPMSIRSTTPLVLAGKTDGESVSITEYIRTLQAEGFAIRYLGYVNDSTRAALYEGAGIFVLPSHYEGFGMPILEALQHQLPVLVSDIPVFHEVADEAGIYFDKDDPNDLAKKLDRALTDSKTRNLLLLALPKRLGAFSWQESAQRVIEAFERQDT